MSPPIHALLLSLAVFLVCVARLVAHAAAQRLLDLTAAILAGVVLVVDIIALA